MSLNILLMKDFGIGFDFLLLIPLRSGSSNPKAYIFVRAGPVLCDAPRRRKKDI
jgi:hypothetical protein